MNVDASASGRHEADLMAAQIPQGMAPNGQEQEQQQQQQQQQQPQHKQQQEQKQHSQASGVARQPLQPLQLASAGTAGPAPKANTAGTTLQSGCPKSAVAATADVIVISDASEDDDDAQPQRPQLQQRGVRQSEGPPEGLAGGREVVVLDGESSEDEQAPPAEGQEQGVVEAQQRGGAAEQLRGAGSEEAAEGAEEEDQEEDEWEEEEEEECDWALQIWEALQGHGEPAGAFACSGRLGSCGLPAARPSIEVAGVGRLALPLSAEGAAALKAACEQAPYGKGMDTVVDTTVRDALQVGPEQITIGKEWDPVLTALVQSAAGAIGVEGPALGAVGARLYKMLLYEEGGHFLEHQDTEKEAGQFATLVVQLPCAGGHRGGALRVRHKGASVKVDFERASQEEAVEYAAFYTDCHHKLSPITAGRRLVLVYNLVWSGPPAAAPRPRRDPAASQLRAAARAWAASGDSGQRLALPLEHVYTSANLGRARREALRFGGDSQVIDSEVRTMMWIGRDGTRVDYGQINEEADFYSGPDGPELFDEDADPDDENYEGYTGNAGVVSEVAAALRALRGAAGVAALDNAAESLLRRSAPAQAAACATLVSLLAPPPGAAADAAVAALHARLSAALAAEVLSPQGLSRQHVSALPCLVSWVLSSDALRAPALAALAAHCAALPAGAPQALHALLALPALRARLALPEVAAAEAQIVEALTRDASLAFQRDSEICILIDYILKSDAHRAARLSPLAAHCVARQGAAELLRTLLRLPSLRARGALPGVRALAAARVAQLEARRAPEFSWRQPAASLPGYPQVELFLRGPQQSATFHLFNGIAHARNWANKYFTHAAICTYSAQAVPGGRGGGAYCTVTKTRALFQREAALHKELMAELEEARDLLRG
ncbi:hypothetical protein MNEG_8915 [Monoraphidium neglectum]|uniref:Uncharacterized protein n=1 Tax=Monoraphidium neglectum TaxID=145388 RepID=A0A0D2JI65_9CHLO|nr:hypothetical protein MNEG_8915 [Monoraphidium neglectum]KIY99047.1 hypothetical protein MNEG_8915 [Monoraphidium neglectum]|eukprot:XP_013898067.1 hypothetical protein MNEG_8915 [Monoraphidium neglectum]